MLTKFLVWILISYICTYGTDLMQRRRGVRHVLKSRTLWLKSVFKTNSQFSKHKLNQFSKRKSVFKTQIQFSKHKISSQNTKSVFKTQNQFSKAQITQYILTKIRKT